MKVEGLAALDQALGTLPQSTAKGVLRRVGRRALEPFDEAWRRNAPELSGRLEKSGGIGSKLTRSQRKAHDRDSFVEVFAGPGPEPQAIAQEFGTSHNAAQPFVRPAWEENKDRALEIVKGDLGAEISKTAERARKRAAAKAARGT